MSTTYLFVGGPADGERRVVEAARSVYVITERLQRKLFDPTDPRAATTQEHHYVLWTGLWEGTEVYFHESLSPAKALKTIIARYPLPFPEP